MRTANSKHDPADYAAPHSDEMITKQAFKDSCDINNILARFQKTGVIEHVSKHQAEYGFMTGETFTDQMMQIAKAKSMFNELPSQARAHFENDPAKFLDYVDNLDIEGQKDELISMGLMEDIHPREVTRHQQKEHSEKPNPENPPNPANTGDSEPTA